MKRMLTAFLAVLIWPLLSFSQPNVPRYDVRLVVNEVNCENDFVLVDIEVKANNPGSNFQIAHQNYRFTFNDDAINNPQIETELNFSGFTTTTNPPSFSFYSPHTLTGSSGDLISYNIFLSAGAGFPLGPQWIGVGRIRFDLVDINECLDLDWNQPEPIEFPGTSIVGKQGGFLFPVESGNFSEEVVCPENICGGPQITSFDAQFNNVTIDCANMKLLVDLEVRASDPGTMFNAAFMNLRFTFNNNALSNPVIEQQFDFSEFVFDGPVISFYNPHTLTGSVGNLLSYNVALTGGPGKVVNNTWAPVGRVSFDILDINECANLLWNDSSTFPNTVMVENLAGIFTIMPEDSYNTAEACLFDSCPSNFEVPITNIKLMPVPVNDFLGIELEMTSGAGVQFSVVDMNGRITKQRAVKGFSGKNEWWLDLTDHNSGVYTLVIETINYRVARQIVVANTPYLPTDR